MKSSSALRNSVPVSDSLTAARAPELRVVGGGHGSTDALVSPGGLRGPDQAAHPGALTDYHLGRPAHRGGQPAPRRTGRGSSDLAHDSGRYSRGRWGQRAQPIRRSRYRCADGADEEPASAGGQAATACRPGVRNRLDSRIRAGVRAGRQRAERRAGPVRKSLLRAGLYVLAEAHDAAEHRDRRHGRRGTAARRLGGSTKRHCLARRAACS